MKNYDIEMWKYAKELKARDTLLGHVHKESKKAILQDVEIKLNSHGMRSPEPISEKSKILFIGSSISLGWGVPLNKSYPQLLSENLANQNLNYQILNGSVGNYNTYRYVENFLKNQKDIDPKVLVVNYFINDAEILPMGSRNILLENSELAASLTIAVKKMLSENNESLVDYYKELYRDENSGFKLMKKSLKKLSNYTSENDIEVYFVIIPDIHFLQDYPFKDIHTKMSTIAQKYNFKVIDFYEVFKGIPFSELQIIPGDSHPNEYGHKLMGKELSDNIISDLK